MSQPATLRQQASPVRLAEKFYRPRGSQATKEEAIVATRYRAEVLFNTDPDDRLVYMKSAEWGFSTDHLRQVNLLMDHFLDPTSRQEIRNLTNECLQEGESPLGMAGQWFTPKRCERLQELLDATNLPDTLLVACHAWLEIHELDQVAYLLAEKPEAAAALLRQLQPDRRRGRSRPALRQRRVTEGKYADRQ